MQDEQLASLQVALEKRSSELSAARAVQADAEAAAQAAQAEARDAEASAEAAKAALAKARKDQDAERERVKKAMGEMKRKLDRCVALVILFPNLSWCFHRWPRPRRTRTLSGSM